MSSQEEAAAEERARRYQRVWHRCSWCARFIHDGSERAWTGKFDAPRGEYRYRCETCALHLCETCYDSREAKGHPADHVRR